MLCRFHLPNSHKIMEGAYRYLKFTHKETETEWLCDLPEITQGSERI